MKALQNLLRVDLSRVATRVFPALLVGLTTAIPFRTPEAQAQTAALPAHFAFGTSAGEGDTWMPQTGVPWDFRYQYLVGGVNTGSGWETWNTSGTFALNYANESAQHGYIPMFPYYELLQSSGSCGSCGEAQRDIANLNTPSLMNAYYTNFALLMQRLGPGTHGGYAGYGKTALVDIEADFSGGYAYQAVNNNANCFGYCTGQGNDPALLEASVASSGYSGVSGYANTYSGFTRALAHLRDLYAPNVLLGYEISPWATGDDIGLDTSTTLNATTLGQQVGVFIGKLGAHDVLFNNPSDRDAGQYKYVYGQPTRFWDRLNVKFPNFHRWEQYLHAAASSDGSRPMYLWQVPVGNQYFDTENNTDGHYQDNRAEYIFGHVSELVQNGIYGAMFGAGNGGNSTYTDAKHDGVTNSASVCTTDGISSGQICNTHTSTVSDDDGGYIRMSGSAYYGTPVALTAGSAWTATPTPTRTPVTSTPTPTPTSTTTPAQPSYTTTAGASPTSVTRPASVSISTSVKSAAAGSALVDVEVYNAGGTKVFQQYWDNQSFTAGQTRTYASSYSIPTSAGTGTYSVRIGIFSNGWATLYSWNSQASTFGVH